jgi:hypothetical protein
MEEIVRQVAYLPELCEDARSKKYKIDKTMSDYTRSCVQTVFLLRMSTLWGSKHVEDSNKHIIEEIVCQAG